MFSFSKFFPLINLLIDYLRIKNKIITLLFNLKFNNFSLKQEKYCSKVLIHSKYNKIVKQF